MSKIKKFVETNPLVQYFRRFYRLLFPKWMRSKIENFLFEPSKPLLKRKILKYYYSRPEQINPEIAEVLSFLKNNKLEVFPYKFRKTYNKDRIKVTLDETLNLMYVLHNSKKLYFKRSWDQKRIQTAYNNLLIEQHPQSPHCYMTEKFRVYPGEIVADIGVAEGIFALDIIEQAKFVHLFEADPEWIEALQATFAPWEAKTVIINKWVSDLDDEKYISLDTYFKTHEPADFIKIDVDGFEGKILAGCKSMFNGKRPLKLALCTYHKQDDYKLYSMQLKEYGFEASPSNGYMIFHWGDIRPPYLRRGLIRANRS